MLKKIKMWSESSCTFKITNLSNFDKEMSTEHFKLILVWDKTLIMVSIIIPLSNRAFHWATAQTLPCFIFQFTRSIETLAAVWAATWKCIKPKTNHFRLGGEKLMKQRAHRSSSTLAEETPSRQECWGQSFVLWSNNTKPELFGHRDTASVCTQEEKATLRTLMVGMNAVGMLQCMWKWKKWWRNLTQSASTTKNMMNLIFREYPPVGALVRAPGSQNINIEVQEPNSYSNTPASHLPR